MKKWFVLALLLVAVPCFAADVTIKWDAVTGATGYKIYQSTNNGTTWSAGTDVGLVTERTVTGVIETGLVLFRVSAYNAQQESIRTYSGAWYNHLWRPINTPGGTGIQ